MEILNSRLKKLNKTTRNSLWIAVIFLIISIACFGWAYYINESTVVDSGITLHDLIYEGSTKEGEIVEVTVTEKPYVFAEYDTNLTSPKYYFLMDEEYLYIGYLDYATYQELDNDNINNDPITIKGLTKKIPDDVIDLAIEVYNEETGEEFLTKDNYKNYIGEIFIDTTEELVDDVLQIILGLLFLIISFVYFIVYIVVANKYKKIKKDSVLWEQITDELSRDSVIEYSKFGLYLTDSYIIDGNKGFTVIPYSDVYWTYLHEQKYNGITCSRCLIVITVNKKKYEIALLGGIKPKLKDTYTEIFNNIYNKNNDILIGFTKENKLRYKEFKKK